MRRRNKRSPKEQRRRDLKKKHRLNMLRRIAVFLICVAGLGVLGYSFVVALNDGVFDVRTIEVEGSELIPKETIIEESGIREGDNIFLVNVNEAQGRISDSLITRRLVIRKVMPDKIVIQVEEKPVLFAVNDNGQICYFGENLELITKSEYLTRSDVPLVSGLTSYQIGSVGDALTAEPAYKFDIIVEMLIESWYAFEKRKCVRIHRTVKDLKRICHLHLITSVHYADFCSYFGNNSQIVCDENHATVELLLKVLHQF